jgi:two-component system NtrC family sensor kinase
MVHMPPLAPPNPAESTRTILVVDDDDHIRALLRIWFAALGFEVVAAAGGGEALALLGSREYDVVICDLLMPNMTGDELFRLCRERWPEVARHFVFLSGGPRGLPAVDFAAASGQPCLAKPCRLAEMQAAIEQVG